MASQGTGTSPYKHRELSFINKPSELGTGFLPADPSDEDAYFDVSLVGS